MRHAVLALLAQAPAHGYELKQAIEQLFGEAWPPLNIGQIYTTLGRLERDELVRSVHVAQEGRPDKRVYELTPSGREALHAWLHKPCESPRLRDEFFMKLVLASIPGVNGAEGGASVAELIQRQRLRYLQALRQLNLASLDRDPDEYPPSALLIEGAILHLQADLKWLDLCEQRLLHRS